MRKNWIFAVLVACFITTVGAFEKLRVYDESNPSTPLIQTSDYQEMAAVLGDINIRFEQWQANQELPVDFTQEGVIAAYQDDVNRLVMENGYKSVDVIRMFPDNPKKQMLREKFLNEHQHSEDEVRFFVEGSGLFYLHVEDRVYLVFCEKGDLISIPACYSHWFDMGDEPFFTAIRFFVEPNGWIANFTGSDIAKSFPRFGE